MVRLEIVLFIAALFSSVIVMLALILGRVPFLVNPCVALLLLLLNLAFGAFAFPVAATPILIFATGLAAVAVVLVAMVT